MGDMIDRPHTQHPTIAAVREGLVADHARIEAALPGHLRGTAGDFVRLALVEFRKAPKLLDCDPRSIISSVLDAARLGLKPGPLGAVYFVPHGKECSLIVGYRGLIELATRTGHITKVEARVAYEGEDFQVRLGTEPSITHLARFDVPHTWERVVAVYAVAHLKEGGTSFCVMTREEVEVIRERSKARTGPWMTDTIQMAVKTVIKRAAKLWPASSALAEAIALDNDATGYETMAPRRAQQDITAAALTWTEPPGA